MCSCTVSAPCCLHTWSSLVTKSPIEGQNWSTPFNNAPTNAARPISLIRYAPLVPKSTWLIRDIVLREFVAAVRHAVTDDLTTLLGIGSTETVSPSEGHTRCAAVVDVVADTQAIFL